MTGQTPEPEAPPAPLPESAAEAGRILAEYARRKREIPAARYSWNRVANQFSFCQLFRLILGSAATRSLFPLAGRRILDVGCGSGTWLLEFVQWGADPSDTAGIDLEAGRIAEAQKRLPRADLRLGNAERIPWPDGSFDLVSQFTLFTSVLSPPVKRRIAAEILRVLKPDGAILWYDFRFDNPRNSNVKGIGAREIRTLFPGCSVDMRSVTLAPPLARLLAPVSWTLAFLLERIPALRTHYLAVIRKTPANANTR